MTITKEFLVPGLFSTRVALFKLVQTRVSKPSERLHKRTNLKKKV